MPKPTTRTMPPASETTTREASDPTATCASPPSAAAFPPITELLPHRGRAVLLGRVLAHDASTTVCTVDPDGGALFRDADGRVPSWVGLEFMAQAVAAHGGLLDREAARPPRPGLFLGSRRLEFSVAAFEPGEPLEVTATHLRGSTGLLAFACSIRTPGAAEPMVSGILTVYLLESFEALARDFTADD
jgi:predicted hotdog family 3-hydroxylacyl-ACP dehydratase